MILGMRCAMFPLSRAARELDAHGPISGMISIADRDLILCVSVWRADAPKVSFCLETRLQAPFLQSRSGGVHGMYSLILAQKSKLQLRF